MPTLGALILIIASYQEQNDGPVCYDPLREHRSSTIMMLDTGLSGPTLHLNTAGILILALLVAVLAVDLALRHRGLTRPGRIGALVEPLVSPSSFTGGVRWTQHGMFPLDVNPPLARLTIGANGVIVGPNRPWPSFPRQIPEWNLLRNELEEVRDVTWGVALTAGGRTVIFVAFLRPRESVLAAFEAHGYPVNREALRVPYVFY